MTRLSRSTALAMAALALAAGVLFAVEAAVQDRAVRRPAPRAQAGAIEHNPVFVGGYFYDPFFGPYPWWSPSAYPYAYFPTYEQRAEVRMLVARKDAAVYADGFYAGTVDDFDGRLGALPLPPGGHGIVLHLEGYRTVRRNIYLRAASTFELHEVLERLPPGVMSEPPPISPRLPPPPAGTFTAPRTPTPPYPSEVVVLELLDAVPFGRLDLLVHPPTAEVTVDGDRWDSSDAGHLALQLRAGVHRVEVRQSGYRTFTTDLDILESTTVPLKISLRAHTLP